MTSPNFLSPPTGCNEIRGQAPVELIDRLIEKCPCTKISDREVWLIQQAYGVGYWHCQGEYEFAAMDLYPPPFDLESDTEDEE